MGEVKLFCSYINGHIKDSQKTGSVFRKPQQRLFPSWVPSPHTTTPEAKSAVLREAVPKDSTISSLEISTDPGHPALLRAAPKRVSGVSTDLGPGGQLGRVRSGLEGQRLSFSASWLQGQRKKPSRVLVVSIHSCFSITLQYNTALSLQFSPDRLVHLISAILGTEIRWGSAKREVKTWSWFLFWCTTVW